MSDYRHDPDLWPFTEPPEVPPSSLADALATPLRALAGCWIESRCPGCGNVKRYLVRMLLTEHRGRAPMPLRRAVEALLQCERCQRWGIGLALVSDPRWRESKAAGKPPNWSMMLSGSQGGTVAFTETDVASN